MQHFETNFLRAEFSLTQTVGVIRVKTAVVIVRTICFKIDKSEFCIYVLQMSPTVNRDYFPNQYQKVDQYYGEMLCFL
jgi:hypothetical protein